MSGEEEEECSEECDLFGFIVVGFSCEFVVDGSVLIAALSLCSQELVLVFLFDLADHYFAFSAQM